MSKKLACGAPNIVLDVKCGRGAFFRTQAEARAFAELACRIGTSARRKVSCVISAMDQPLGWAVGNALEVQEAAGLLSGQRDSPELRAACLALGEEALGLVGAHGYAPGGAAGPAADTDGRPAGVPSQERAHIDNESAARWPPLPEILSSGAAWECFQQWIAAQGGDWAAFVQQASEAQQRYRQVEVRALDAGWIAGLDALAVGQLACELGAGRKTKDDVIDPWVGIECLAKTGERVEPGQVIARLTVKPNEPRSESVLVQAYRAAVRTDSEAVPAPAVALETIRAPI